MAGHSQFKNIMFRKGRQDKERSKLFSKLAREITVSAKQGMPDPAHNPRLRAAIAAAQGAVHAQGQHPARHRQGERRWRREYRGNPLRGLRSRRCRSDRRGADRQPQPHRQRCALAFSKYGGALGEPNSVTFMFDRVGVIAYPKEQGIRRCHAGGGNRGGSQRMRLGRGDARIHHRYREFRSGARCAGGKFGAAQSANIEWRPQNSTPVSDEAGEIPRQAARRAGRSRRRAERIWQLRAFRFHAAQA